MNCRVYIIIFSFQVVTGMLLTFIEDMFCIYKAINKFHKQVTDNFFLHAAWIQMLPCTKIEDRQRDILSVKKSTVVKINTSNFVQIQPFV